MKIGLKLGTWYLSLKVIWIILFLFCSINLCIFVKLGNYTFGHCKIMSIKISAVAFLGSESLKLLSMPMGVLQLSEIGLFYFNKITIWLSSSNDSFGSIF